MYLSIVVKLLKVLVMSYEIVYDKQFIKVNTNNGNKYVPMVLSGSNNCYEWSNGGKERRARSWFPFSLDGNLLVDESMVNKYWENSLEEIINRTNDTKNDIKKSFGYYTGIYVNGNRNTSYGNIKGIFDTGMEKALTIEQLKGEGISVIVSTGWITKGSELKPLSVTVENDNEFIGAINKLEEHVKDSKVSITVKFSGMHEEKPKYIRKKFFAKPEKELIKTNEVHVIKVSNGTYVYKSHRGGFNYVWDAGTAKYYGNLNTIKNQIKSLKKRFSDLDFEVETIKLNREVYI